MGQHRKECSRTADGSVGQICEIKGGLAGGSKQDTPEKPLSQTLKILCSKALTVPWTSRPPDVHTGRGAGVPLSWLCH